MPVKKSQAVLQLERLPLVGRSVKRAYVPWLDLKFKLYTDYLLNPHSERLFQKQKPNLSNIQQKLVADLDQNGFATAGFADLFDDPEFLNTVSKYVADFAASPEVIDRGNAFSKNDQPANIKDHIYMTRHFKEDQVIAFDDPMMQLGVSPKLLDVVNTFLGLFSRLKKIHLWYTYPSGSDRMRTGPQNWHRDPEDQRMVTVFLYFTEIDETAGPLQYIPSTRFHGERRNVWPIYGGSRPASAPTPEEIDQVVDPSDRFTITCPQLTFLFCDTTGFHRGGYAINKPRIVAHWTYASPASLWPRRFKLDRKLDSERVPEAVKFALS